MGPAQPSKSRPLKTLRKPSSPRLARMAFASAAGISRMKTLRQRISPPCVWSSIRPVGGVPDLHLRRTAQVNAAVGERHRFVLNQQLEVAVLLVSAEVRAVTVVDQFAVLGAPMLFGLIQPFGRVFGALLGAHGREF